MYSTCNVQNMRQDQIVSDPSPFPFPHADVFSIQTTSQKNGINELVRHLR